MPPSPLRLVVAALLITLLTASCDQQNIKSVPTVAAADALLKQGKAKEAATLYQTLLKLHGGNRAVHLGLGKAQMILAEYAGAARSFAALAGGYPKDPLVRWLQGNAQLAAGECAAAVEALRAAVAAAPEQPVIHLDLAAALQRQGDEAGAIEVIREAAWRWPASAPLYRRLALLLKASGEPAAAAGALRMALGLAARTPGDLRMLAQMVRRVGNEDEATDLEREAAELQRGDGTARPPGKESSPGKDRPPAKTAAELRVAMKQRPADPVPLVDLLVLLGDQGKDDEARALLEQAVGGGWSKPQALSTLGATLVGAGLNQMAARALGRAHELRPGDRGIAAGLGVALGRLGQVERSRKLLAGALARRPRDLGFVIQTADTLVEAGQARAAQELFSRRVKDKDLRAHLLCGLALVRRAQGKPKKSEAALASLVRLNPSLGAECDGWLKRAARRSAP